VTGRRQFWFWLGGVAAVAGLVWLFSAILLPFVAAMVLAYLLDPLVDRLEKLGVGRAAGTVIVLVAFFLLATATLLLLFPVLSAQIADFAARVPELLSALRERLGGFLQAIESCLGGHRVAHRRAVERRPGAVQPVGARLHHPHRRLLSAQGLGPHHRRRR
jgi:predicted PurR-regulated permease PerM